MRSCLPEGQLLCIGKSDDNFQNAFIFQNDFFGACFFILIKTKFTNFVLY